MKALSLWQPWASLYVLGVKALETRSWPTSYRGPLLVHAAQRMDVSPPAPWAALEDRGFTPDNVPRGALVGAVRLSDVFRTDGLVVGFGERQLGDFSPGRFAWEATSRVVFARPRPWLGRQGLFEVDTPDAARIVEALEAGGGVFVS